MADSIEIIDPSPEELDNQALLTNQEPKADPKCSVPFRPHTVSAEIRRALNILANILLDEIAAAEGITREESKGLHDRPLESMRYVLLNLLTAWRRFDKETEARTGYIRPCVAYPRGKNVYSTDHTLTKYHLRWAPTMQAVDGLARLGLIECVPGFYDQQTRVGFVSRMRANKELIQRMLDSHVDPDQVEVEHPRLIEMKAKKDKRTGTAKRIDVSERDKTKRLELSVIRINEMLRQANVTLRISREERIDLMLHNCGKADKELNITPMPNPRKNTVRRVFNNNSFEQGGRFYGHWVQNIPRRFRGGGHLFLNGSPIVELDFKEFHIRMLYRLRNLPMPDQAPYALDGWPDRYRKAIKLITNTLINAEDVASARNSAIYGEKGRDSIADEYGLSHEDVDDILDSIRQKHHAIASDLPSGAGVRLQFLDSEIARRVMLSLWAQGIASVPLHDSFIVAKEHAEVLDRALAVESARLLGQAIPVDVKHGRAHYQRRVEVNA